MNKEDIIRMAREAGISTQYDSDNGKDWTANVWGGAMQTRVMEHFAALVAAAEREACARIVYGLCISDNNAQEIVTAIRARGNK